LPPCTLHSSLQPLDVGHCSPLQHHYSKAVEDYFLTADIFISQNTVFPLFKAAQQEAYIKENIEHEFTA